MGHLSLSSSLAVHLWVEVAALYLVARILGIGARRLGRRSWVTPRKAFSMPSTGPTW